MYTVMMVPVSPSSVFRINIDSDMVALVRAKS